MIQTAEGALNETHDILQRMREFTVNHRMIQQQMRIEHKFN